MAVLLQAGQSFPDIHDAFYDRLRWVSTGPVSIGFPALTLPSGDVVQLPGINTNSGYAAQIAGGYSIALLGQDITPTRETGRLATGTVTAVVMIDSSNDTRFALFDTSISAAQVMAVAATSGTEDDRALFAARLGGDDLVMGHETLTLAETLHAGAGDDLVMGYAGADLIDGGTGNDLLVGGLGRDTIRGGGGNDLIGGDEGDRRTGTGDVLNGGAGNDRILADGAGYRLTGGGGADVFVFLAGGTGSVITDFTENLDRILLDGWTGGFAGLRFAELADGVLQVRAGTTVFRLQGVDRADLDAQDFIFGRSALDYAEAQIDVWLNGWDYAS